MMLGDDFGARVMNFRSVERPRSLIIQVASRTRDPLTLLFPSLIRRLLTTPPPAPKSLFLVKQLRWPFLNAVIKGGRFLEEEEKFFLIGKPLMAI